MMATKSLFKKGNMYFTTMMFCVISLFSPEYVEGANISHINFIVIGRYRDIFGGVGVG